MNRKTVFVVGLILFLGASFHLQAQLPAPSGQMFSPGQLDQMLGPIALYPDPLIAQILPAAAQPSQIALAHDYISRGGDPAAAASQPWDSSVKALAYYPDVLQLLDGNLSWTAQLGEAFLNQPTDVMDSIQRLRAQAQSLGNLQTTPQQDVIVDNGVIEIDPVDPGLIYVPIYDAGIVFLQRCFGPPFITFGRGFRIGAWLDHDFDWRGRNLLVWDHDHPRPADWWRTPPSRRPVAATRNVVVWHPPPRAAVTVAHSGDRGYAPRPTAAAPARVVRPAAPAVRVAAPAVRAPAPAPSAFSSFGSAASTRAASARGAQSRQVVSHAAPPPRAAPAPEPNRKRESAD